MIFQYVCTTLYDSVPLKFSSARDFLLVFLCLKALPSGSELVNIFTI